MLNINFFTQSKATLIDQCIRKYIEKDQKKVLVLFTPNPEQIVLSRRNPAFLAALQEADLCIPDGIGVVIANRLLHHKNGEPLIQERITGVDMMTALLQSFPQLNYMVIGGRADGELSQLRRVEVKGRKINWLPGYQDITHPSQSEEKTVRAAIHQVKPDVLFVAFGAPHQEFWVLRHRAYLESQNVKIAMVIGGALDMLTGKVRRAPQFVRLLGLEWIFRLTQEPWRWKRQLQLFTYVHLVWKELFA